MPIGTVDWIAEGMLEAPLVNCGNGPGGQPLGVAIPVRNQFFHGSHPVGWVRDIELDLDGHRPERDALSLVLRGQRLSIPQMRHAVDIWWQPREVAHIVVDLPGGLAVGTHAVELTMHLSTFFFTPVIDRDDRYPTIAMRLGARLPMADQHEELF